MALVLTAAPAVEPVSLAEAKTHLRVDGSAEDTLIASLIITSQAARGSSPRPRAYHAELVVFPRCLARRPACPPAECAPYEASTPSNSTLPTSPSKR